MKKLTAQKTLNCIIDLLTYYLEQLQEVKSDGEQFKYGEKTAYIECLELIQLWDKADENGLDFNIEERFPL